MAKVPATKVSDAILKSFKFDASRILTASTIAALGSAKDAPARRLLDALASESKLAESMAKMSALPKELIQNASLISKITSVPVSTFEIYHPPVNPMPALTRELINKAEASHQRMIDQNEEIRHEREERRLEKLAEARRRFWSQALNIFLALVAVGSLVVAIVK